MSGLIPYLFSLLLMESACAAAFGVFPDPLHAFRLQCDSVIILRLKVPDLLLPHGDHGQRGSLHSSAGKLGVIFTGQRPRTVDPHQPVGLGPRGRRPVKIIVFFSVFQIMKSVSDRFIRNRRNPQTAERFAAAGFFQYPPGYKFPFSSRVCGDHNVADIFAEKLCLYRLILFRSLTDDHQLHFFRQHGKSTHIPFHILLIVLFRIRQCHKVSQRPGDNIILSFQRSAGFLVTVKHSGNVSCHRGLFSNYK